VIVAVVQCCSQWLPCWRKLISERPLAWFDIMILWTCFFFMGCYPQQPICAKVLKLLSVERSNK
jgi:hypothetical protein